MEKLFHQECERLKVTFSRLCYPEELVQSTIRRFIESKVSEDALTQQQELKEQHPIRIVLPFKDQKSANSVRRQLGDLSRKINVDISPVYTSRKIKDEIKVRENKPPLVNQQCELCIIFSVTCVMQGMSAIRADIFTNGSKNTRDRPLEITSRRNTI